MAKRLQRVCHDTLPWLISVSLDRMHRVLLLLFIVCNSVAAASVPADFVFHAHFSPGGGPGSFDDTSKAGMARWPKPWDIQLNAAGKAKREVDLSVIRGNVLDSKPVYDTVMITPAALNALVTAIQEANFFSLPSVVSGAPYQHSGGAFLWITLGGRTHKVALYSAAESQNRAAIRRLRRVWQALFRALPSPNQNRELSWFSSGRETI
jgi:hypothetical protein